MSAVIAETEAGGIDGFAAAIELEEVIRQPFLVLSTWLALFLLWLWGALVGAYAVYIIPHLVRR